MAHFLFNLPSQLDLLSGLFCFLAIYLSINLKLGSLLSQIIILIGLYILGSLFFTYLDFYFLGLTYIIVYVGAIAILFLFILMICFYNPIETSSNFHFYLTLLFILGSLYLIMEQIIPTTFYITNWYTLFFTLNDIHIYSLFLFKGFPLILLIIGLFLWILLLGILSI